MPLKIAAKVDRVDQAYWEEKIRPMVEAHSNVEFVGEINEHEKAAFLGDAVALLFPIDWPEPFGLVMIEAMACGTPVIAFRRGSVSEILEDGTSGFIVDTIEQAVTAVAQAASLDRAVVRAEFETRFTAERMANDYQNSIAHRRSWNSAIGGQARQRTAEIRGRSPRPLRPSRLRPTENRGGAEEQRWPERRAPGIAMTMALLECERDMQGQQERQGSPPAEECD